MEMKWQNRGHEFDEKAVYWCSVKTIFIYGLSDLAKELGAMLTFTNIDKDIKIVFVDSDIQKQQSGYKNYPVISLPDLLGMIASNGGMNWYVIVDCTYESSVSMLLQCYEKICVGENLFSFGLFIKSFLPVVLWYRFGKAFCPSAAIHFSTHCNLKCVGCGVFTERYYPKQDRALEDVYKDIDILFNKFDYIWHAGTCGGEPFLYRQLPELLRYASKYAHKVFSFGNVTNGTISASPAIVAAYEEFNTKSPYANVSGGGTLVIDDYSESVPFSRLEAIYAEFRRHGIHVQTQRYANWVDFRVMKANHINLQDEALTAFHDICNNSCWWLCDGRFYTCGMTLSASHAGFLIDEPNNSIDL